MLHCEDGPITDPGTDSTSLTCSNTTCLLLLWKLRHHMQCPHSQFGLAWQIQRQVHVPQPPKSCSADSCHWEIA